MSPDVIASVSGRDTGAVVVTTSRGGYRIVAGPADDRTAQVVLDVDPADLRRFVDQILEHLKTRTGARRSVPFEDAYPSSARLVAGSADLTLLDDGDTMSVMARSGGAKAGTGAFASVAGVREFAQDLDRHLNAGS